MKIVCLGDSLTYGYGIRRSCIWTKLAEDQLNDSQHNVRLLNKGINGDTTNGMLSRFERDVLKETPDILFLMGGSNDIFFSGTIDMAKNNIAAIAMMAMAANIKVVLGIPFPICRDLLSEQWLYFADKPEVSVLLQELKSWILSFSACFHIPVIDFQSCFLSDSLPKESFYLDGIHPSKETHKQIATIFSQKITPLL